MAFFISITSTYFGLNQFIKDLNGLLRSKPVYYPTYKIALPIFAKNKANKMFSETQHENMYLNAASNFIAILLGCIVAANHKTIDIPSNFISVFFNPDTYEFIFHALVNGSVALSVKFAGEAGIHMFKQWHINRKNKGGNNG